MYVWATVVYQYFHNSVLGPVHLKGFQFLCTLKRMANITYFRAKITDYREAVREDNECRGEYNEKRYERVISTDIDAEAYIQIN